MLKLLLSFILINYSISMTDYSDENLKSINCSNYECFNDKECTFLYACFNGVCKISGGYFLLFLSLIIWCGIPLLLCLVSMIIMAFNCECSNNFRQGLREIKRY